MRLVVPAAALLAACCSSLFAQQTLFQAFGPLPGASTGSRLAGGGDLDGDGVPDLLTTSPGAGGGLAHAVSGANGTVRSFAHAGGEVFAIVPDANLDTRADILLSQNGSLRLLSGATLAQLWQSANAYSLAAAVGDRDGDGRGDIAAITSNPPHELRVLRGSNGSILAQYPVTISSGNSLIAIGDVTGDGVTELALVDGSSTFVLQLAASPILTTANLAGTRVAAANFTGDARNEIVVGRSNAVNILSATTGAVLRTFAEVEGGSFALIGDANADGVPDLALRRNLPSYLTGHGYDLVSGSNGAVLARVPPSAQVGCVELAGLGDVNNDGFADFAVGDPGARPNGPTGTATGAWQIVSGKVLAFREMKPTNCAFGPFLPQLGTTLPRVGTSVIVAGQDGPVAGVGLVAFSLQPAAATNLGTVGCDAWFDLASGSLLHTATTPSWQFALPIPLAPQLAGVAIALQTVYVPSPMPLGFDLSNGIWAHIGW